MIIIERIIQNHHVIQTSSCFLGALAEVLLRLDVLLVHQQVLIQIKCIQLVQIGFLDVHLWRLVHFIGLGLAQRFSLLDHLGYFMALVYIIIVQRVQRMASCLWRSCHFIHLRLIS